MKRSEPCAHLRPDYNRLEVAHHVRRDPVTDEISWEPSSMEEELHRLGLVSKVVTANRFAETSQAQRPGCDTMPHRPPRRLVR